MKNLFRYVFAAVLATAFYSFSNGSESTTALNDPNDMYEFVEDHPLHGQEKTRQEIEDDNLCPGTQQLCASAVDGSTEPILWSGPTSKF